VDHGENFESRVVGIPSKMKMTTPLKDVERLKVKLMKTT
jgi:hypothetical protein